MFSRRFILLGGVLVALNLALWLAAPGLALRHAVVSELFGPKMIRAEAVEKSAVGGSSDWRLDRGVIVSVTPTQLTLREADGRIQSIPVSGSTRVIRLGQRMPLTVLAPRWRVLVTWPATGAAQTVDVERIPRGR
ncbi:MAG TPA: hypothetical protein VFU30_04165 [Gaiellaceae bacterium]|nr:hypothetical protein [Gaiellaceae bacterium]